MKKIILTFLLTVIFSLSAFSQTSERHVLNLTKNVWKTNSAELDTCYWLKIPNSDLFLVKVKTLENSQRRIWLFIFRDRKGLPYEWVKNTLDLVNDEKNLPVFKSNIPENSIRVSDVIEIYKY